LKKDVESFPSKLPDLYSGEPLISVAKFKTSELPDTLSFTGDYPQTSWDTDLNVKEAPQAKGLSVLWARRKIADLEEQRFDRASANKIDKAILKTALEYHLVSRLTSLVAVDVTPSRDLSNPLFSKSVPTQLPDGWDFASLQSLEPSVQREASLNTLSTPNAPRAVPMPNTASPHVFLILLGSLLMVLSRVFKRLFRARHVY